MGPKCVWGTPCTIKSLTDPPTNQSTLGGSRSLSVGQDFLGMSVDLLFPHACESNKSFYIPTRLLNDIVTGFDASVS